MSTQRRATSNQKPDQIDHGNDEDKDKDKGASFIAVRWPSTLRKALKVAAAASEPPVTMTEYLAECFNAIQYEGGLNKIQKASSDEMIIRRTDREQRKLYQELSEKLFKTRDRRLIDLVISLLGYLTRY
jgi:hypothetical protein